MRCQAGAVLVQQAGAMDLLDDFAELAGLSGQIKQQVFPQRPAAERGQHFFQLFVGRGVGEIALAIKKICRELPPDLFVHRFGAGKLVERGAQFLPPRFVGLFAPRKADDAERRRHLLVLAQMIKRGNQLARGQIAARAKNDDGAGFECLCVRPMLRAGGFIR